jgi:hypothetical protein
MALENLAHAARRGRYGHVLLAVLAWLAARAFPLTDVADTDARTATYRGREL